MADLNNLQATETVKIVGSSTSGEEQTMVQSTASGELKSADLLNITSTQGIISVSVVGAAVQVKAGISNLANRKLVMIQAQGTGIVYGFSSNSQPFQLSNGSTMTLSLGENISVWVDRSTGAGSVEVIFAEFS